ncbi:hypothetical protein EOW77_0032410 [Bradyrhizobium yuanmingense]|uniref:hypothetical protein n=1 Tax=Bradyrhizobium yuanmingense TaxID=108015 RepID=UPI000FE2FDB4|nr:hypothetical protein [Bradyrhizobium yuanmingense]TGN75972.1 hypothetical protein EOW77_0032410 [Bradyrhizobium yuanmingense]
MTITVKAPNGATVDFPDGTDSDTINRVMSQNFSKSGPDKYQQAAIDERKALFPDQDAGGSYANGLTSDAGFTRRLAHGATLGADNTILAALSTPFEMIKRGTLDPREGYNYAKAREDLITNEAQKNTGVVGGAVEALGGAVAGGGLAKSGATAARFLSPESGLLARSAASAADAGILGGFSGAMEGNGLDRVENAIKSGLGGLIVGGAAPTVLGMVKGLVSPIVSNIMARHNPKSYAEGQVARAIHESKISPDQLSLDAVQAANEGQGVYTLADAMGNAGQRMLSTVARAPGEGRTAVVQALEGRQGDQGRRLSSAFREAFDAPQTAEQTRARMVENANFEAGHNYAPVKRETAPIDVTAPVAIANRSISPAADNLARAQGAVPTDLAARAGIERSESALRDPIGNALKEARSYLAAPNLTLSNVNHAFRAKTNIDMMISNATDNKQGALVAELVPIRDALDEALARSSSNYSAARDAYRTAQRRIEALDLGKLTGQKPGRPEDAIRAFNELPDAEAQTAFRRGYADPQISYVQNAPFGTNKARPFTSEATRQEFDAFTVPGRGDQLQRQIGREQTMFETRNHALGGSKTVDNLNDHEAMAVDPHIVGQILKADWHGAVKTALTAGHNIKSGNNAEVRRHIADILLQSGRDIRPDHLSKMVTDTIKRIEFVQALAQNAGRAAAGGAAAVIPEQISSRR